MHPLNRREFAGATLAASAATSRLRAAEATIGDTLRDGIATRKIPAVAAMAVSRGRTIFEGAYGVRDDSGAPVRPDSIFAIASMTKAITTVAALQLVEAGNVKLDEPVAVYLPKLKNPRVLHGFTPSGAPILKPAKVPITLKHLLTHTSGLCYDTWDGQMFRYTSTVKDYPPPGPLMFEPGARWQYGTGIDWAGRLVEAVSGMSLEDYFQAKIFRPLEMADTGFILPEAKFGRLVSAWQRTDSGELKQNPRKPPAPPTAFNGGGGLYSTTADYVRFMQMILGKGAAANGVQILSARTVESMELNQIGALSAGKMKSYRPDNSSDVDIQPGFDEKWGLGFLINTTPYPGGRSAGSLAWAGIWNTYYWIDPARAVCAVIMMQYLPFVDREAVGLLADFERAVYRSLSAKTSR
jgi:CubicO group peptidase (beta-lactamase class C family)